MAEQLHLSDRRWDILKVMEHADLSEWRIGPTQGWQRLFEEDAELRKVPLLERTFGQLVRAKPEWVRGHKAIADIQGNFPAETELMALALPEGGIMAFEGHHRITALVAARLLDNRPLPRGDIRVALSYLNPGDVARLPEVIRRGSDRVDKGNWPY